MTGFFNFLLFGTISGEETEVLIMIPIIHDLIEMALREDIGTGDITSESTIPDDVMAKAIIKSKDNGIVAGLDVVGEVFRTLDTSIDYKKLVLDGDRITNGQEIATADGKARSLLTAERTVLNFLQRLSGIATTTSKYVKAISGYHAQIIDTRKTTPGWRVLEKYAVRVGGGRNHRFGLYDAVLIKDNHIAVAGSIIKAVTMARERIPHTMKIEVETETLDQVLEAIESKADIIMLDNMSLKMMTEAVRLIAGKAIVEASGGIKFDSVVEVAKTGVDLISAGALTNSAMPLDISMDIIGMVHFS
jgi:nicotinate-nucleotide pyrophosphorylase (carboxylating)